MDRVKLCPVRLGGMVTGSLCVQGETVSMVTGSLCGQGGTVWIERDGPE